MGQVVILNKNKEIPPRNSAIIDPRFQVWQDGDSFTNIVSGYTATMWMAWCRTIDGTRTISKTKNGIRLENKSTDFMRLWQHAFNADKTKVRAWAGQKVTFGCKCTSITGSAYLIVNSNDFGEAYIPFNKEGIITVTKQSTAALESVSITIHVDPASTVEIEWVDCVAGDTITEPPHMSFSEELARCSSYYRKTYPYGVAPKTTGAAQGALFRAAWSPTWLASTEFVNDPPMAAAPRISIYNYNTTPEMGFFGQVNTSITVEMSAWGASTSGFLLISPTNKLVQGAYYAGHIVQDARP